MDITPNKISFLLGSGFSAPAKIPGVKQINEYLTTLKSTDFLVTSECMAFPQESTNKNTFADFGVESMEDTHRQFVVKFISWYQHDYLKSKNKSFDYEDLFDDIQFFLLGPERDKNFQSFLDFFISANPNSRKGYEPFPSFQIIISWLLAHLLYLKVENDVLLTYSHFVNMIRQLLQKEYQITIQTLNHDCLLEALLAHANIDYCDGFSSKSNWKYQNIETNEVEDILHFENVYSENIHLYKIHGSVDYYSSKIHDKNEVFKSKKYPRLSIILIPGNVSADVDKPSFEIQPFYFTGKKLKMYQYPRFDYTSIQLENFKQNLEQSPLLIVIGYGFQDQSINDIIRLAKGKTIVCDLKQPVQLPFQQNELSFIKKSASDFRYSDISSKLSEIWGEPS